MTKKELYEKDFETAVNELIDEGCNITTYEELKDLAINLINDDNLFFAIHILEAINETEATYYNYDSSMGTMETPTPIETLEDLEDFCEEDD